MGIVRDSEWYDIRFKHKVRKLHYSKSPWKYVYYTAFKFLPSDKEKEILDI